MESVKLSKTELLSIVRTNMSKHIADHVEAINDYKALALKVAEDNLTLARSGDLEQLKKLKAPPPPPVSYEDSYKRATRMLELSVEEVVEIQQDVFNQLVLDEWHWKPSFAASNAFYKSGM